jgi:hypothetical protein
MSMSALKEALDGPMGAVDAYLEVHDEKDVRADIRDLLLSSHATRTLRDDFAAAALQAYLSRDAVHTILGKKEATPAEYAQCAYAWADAMLKAREQ